MLLCLKVICLNKRQKEVTQNALNAEKEVLKKMEGLYQQALNDIQTRILILQRNKETQSQIYRIEYQRQLQAQLEEILYKLRENMYATINEYLTDSYITGYVGTMYDFAGQGFPLTTPIDQRAITNAITTNSRINGGLYASLGVDAERLLARIQEEISRGIATGISWDEMARNLQFAADIPLKRANTIIRTEAHRIQQESTDAARQEAKAKGADVVKQWDATLDHRTRKSHRKLDGQIREVDEYFEVNGKKAMYPGSFGDPAEDCNCRCVALTRARVALNEEELQVLKDRAKHFGLDKTKDFEEFKRKYMKVGN